MSDMYKKIKKQNGEAFAQTLRRYHNGLLEIPDLDKIVRYAGRDVAPLLPYLMSKLAANDDVSQVAPVIEDPIVLLERAGYDAFYADTLQKQNSIQHHFQPGELLCTFKDPKRYQQYHVIHAIKKNVADIKRKDFKGKEQREDAYGTSVISIQILKSGGFISIKNRYNHAIASPDNTFNSNPDNIILGLSAALKNKFNVDFSASKNALPDEYILINNQIVKYHTERNNILYGDGFWVKNGEVHEVNRAAGDVMFEHFVFDNKAKKLVKIDPHCDDSFADDFNRDYGGNKELCIKGGNLVLGDDILIGTEQSRIKTLFLPALEIMSDDCLETMHELKSFSAPVLQSMGSQCLRFVEGMQFFSAPKLQVMGDRCLSHINLLKTIHADALQSMGSECISSAYLLTQLIFPELQRVGNYSLKYLPHLTHLSADSLHTVGNCFLNGTPSLTELSLPSLSRMGFHSIWRAEFLTKINLPALEYIDEGCFSDVRSLNELSLPSLKKMESNCFECCYRLKKFVAPKLETIGMSCFRFSRSLQTCDLGVVQNMPDHLRPEYLNRLSKRAERQITAVFNTVAKGVLKVESVLKKSAQLIRPTPV